MTAESEKIRQTLSAQLSNLDDNLGASSGDVAMLADIQRGIGRLLADNDNFEGEIRRVLQDRFDNGGLRKETYQLVKSMLDRYVSENVSTSPTSQGDEPVALSTTRKPELGEPVENHHGIAIHIFDVPGTAHGTGGAWSVDVVRIELIHQQCAAALPGHLDPRAEFVTLNDHTGWIAGVARQNRADLFSCNPLVQHFGVNPKAILCGKFNPRRVEPIKRRQQVFVGGVVGGEIP